MLQYSSELVEGADNYFVCRDETCIQFSPNTCWMQEYRALDTEEAEDYFLDLMYPGSKGTKLVDDAPPIASLLDHFRCSSCATEFLPWQTKSRFIPANKILVASPGGNPLLAAAMKMGANEVKYWYLEWGDTKTAVFTSRLQEISLRLVEETRNMNHTTLFEHCVRQIDLHSQRSFFERQQLSRGTMEKINRINSGKDGDRKHWKYDHLLDGFWTAKGPEYVREGLNKTVVLTTDEYVTMFAYTKTLCGIHSVRSSI